MPWLAASRGSSHLTQSALLTLQNIEKQEWVSSG
jgi:hypothetical protein